MNVFIFCIFLSGMAHSTVPCRSTVPASQLDYRLSWDGRSTRLIVDLSYNANSKDSTIFVYGDLNGDIMGGQNEIFQILENIYVGAGDSLIVRPKERKLVILHKSGNPKRLHYEINGALLVEKGKERPDQLFRPVISEGSLYILGFDLFMNSADTTYNLCSISWDKAPAGMSYFISTSPTAAPVDKLDWHLSSGHRFSGDRIRQLFDRN